MNTSYKIFKVYNLFLSLFKKKITRDYYLFYLHSETAKKLTELFESMQKTTLNKGGEISHINFDDNVYEKLNKNHDYYLCKNHNFKFLLDSIDKDIKEFTNNTNYKIVNIRSWSTNPNAENFGHMEMHNDGYPPGHLKIMIYKNKMSEENGYLNIKGKKIFSDKDCTAIIFKNSEALHSGMPGTKNKRHILELTLQLTFLPNKKYLVATTNDRHLEYPSL